MESPDTAYFDGVEKSFKDADSYTFGVLGGKLVGQSEIPTELDAWGNPGVLTHYKLYAIALGEFDRCVALCQKLKDLKQKALTDPANMFHTVMEAERIRGILQDYEAESRYGDLKFPGRAWPLGDKVLISFWGDALKDGRINKIISDVLAAMGSRPTEVWVQDETMAEGRWVEWTGEKAGNDIDPEVMGKIQRLSALLHAATAEQKVKIRAEIAALRGDSPSAPPPASNHGGSVVGAQRAAKAGYSNPARWNAARQFESSHGGAAGKKGALR